MERNDWNNRQDYGSDRNRYRGNDSRADEDGYRGAYRFDTTSDHRNQTTWDGFDQRSDRNHRQGTDYNQDFNRNYNNDYNRNYNSDQRLNRGESSGNSDFSRNNPYEDRNDYSRNRQQTNSGDYGSPFGGSERQNRDFYGAGNFNADYNPDNYGGGGGANYGNMAGSLSYGYDGDENSDPDRNRRYDPMSGHHRSYHGHYESRHPERGQNRDNFSRSGNNDSARF